MLLLRRVGAKLLGNFMIAVNYDDFFSAKVRRILEKDVFSSFKSSLQSNVPIDRLAAH